MKAINFLHDQETDTLEKMEIEAYRLTASNIAKKSSVGKLLQLQCRYIIEMRIKSGNRNNKRPWRF